MSCGFYETFMKYVVERDRDAHKFTLKNAHKDMRYLMNLANAAGSANVVAPVVKGYLASAEAMGKGDDYLPMLSDHIASLNGVKLAARDGCVRFDTLALTADVETKGNARASSVRLVRRVARSTPDAVRTGAEYPQAR